MEEMKYKRKYKQEDVGAGYYAMRLNKSKAGIVYRNLVKRDKSPTNTIFALIDKMNKKLVPHVN